MYLVAISSNLGVLALTNHRHFQKEGSQVALSLPTELQGQQQILPDSVLQIPTIHRLIRQAVLAMTVKTQVASAKQLSPFESSMF